MYLEKGPTMGRLAGAPHAGGLRACIINPVTTHADVDALLDAVRAAAS